MNAMQIVDAASAPSPSPVHPPEKQGADHERLDGNALAGLLGELFVGDVTDVRGECGHCGAAACLAEAVVELSPTSAIALCRSCTRTLFTVVMENGHRVLEVGSVRSLAFV